MSDKLPPERPADAIFPGRREAIRDKKCMPPPIGCGKDITSFNDPRSVKEYSISGLCQTCQDSVFGMDPDEFDADFDAGGGYYHIELREDISGDSD